MNGDDYVWRLALRSVSTGVITRLNCLFGWQFCLNRRNRIVVLRGVGHDLLNCSSLVSQDKTCFILAARSTIVPWNELASNMTVWGTCFWLFMLPCQWRCRRYIQIQVCGSLKFSPELIGESKPSRNICETAILSRSTQLPLLLARKL